MSHNCLDNGGKVIVIEADVSDKNLNPRRKNMRKELTPEQKAKPYSKYYYLEEAPVSTQLTAEMNKSPMDPNK